ncbi:MAG: polysaccharide biosynthesis C-terminal domain-containing protein, partial [Bacilli bacterium]|nr:polysaccharide biosynthesis C-terminal domain-containing protein [Bacilli bacterium]
YITVNTLIAASINIILNIIYIPKYGYLAAAYTTLISYLIAFILHSRYAKKIEPNLYPLKMFFRSLIHIFTGIIVFYVFINIFYIRWIILFLYMLLMIHRERFRIMAIIGTKLKVVNKK